MGSFEKENTSLSMYTLAFKEEVYSDIKVSYDWYEKQQIGLGEDFLRSLESSYSQISREPKVYQNIYKLVRRKLINRFPYALFFVLNEKKKSITIIAVMHTKRNPNSWTKRT